MPRVDLSRSPAPGQLWLSRPPYLMVARVLAVERQDDGARIVSYRLYDEDGQVLGDTEHAALDSGWWHAFQLLQPRYG